MFYSKLKASFKNSIKIIIIKASLDCIFFISTIVACVSIFCSYGCGDSIIGSGSVVFIIFFSIESSLLSCESFVVVVTV